MERFSLKRLSAEGLWGKLFTGDPGRYVNPSQTKRRRLYLKTQFVPRSKHFSSGL